MAAIRTREWSQTDYYVVLGVEPDASPEAIDRRYRTLAKQHHPDRAPDPATAEHFKQVSVAYRTLRDPASRASYDDYRARVAEGRLYEAPRPTPPPATPRVDHFAPPRRPRTRAPMPAWARRTIAAVLVVLGCLAALVAFLADLPAPTDADTPLAVQITLLIVAVKLWACGAIVAWYPQLRARWHR